MDLDDELIEPPRPKRPRVGRPHADILQPIEKDTDATGRARHLRAIILHAGENKRNADGGGSDMALVLRGQARDLLAAYELESDRETMLTILMEG
jgi:hypothetical protein